MDYTELRSLIPEHVWTELKESWHASRRNVCKRGVFSEVLVKAGKCLRIKCYMTKHDAENANQIIDCLDLIDPNWRGYEAPRKIAGTTWERQYLSRFFTKSEAA